VNISIGLVDILLSQPSVLTLIKSTTVLKNIIEGNSGLMEMFSAKVNDQEENDCTLASLQKFNNIQQFNDDLRILPFKYVIEDSGNLQLIIIP